MHGGYDGETEWKRKPRVESIVDQDLDRNTLDDLDEVAGGVFRWKGGEARAGAELNAVDVTGELKIRMRVHRDVHLLAGAHAVELRFLEVGSDPDVRRYDGKNCLAGLHIVPLLDIPLGNPAVLRRGDLGPGKIQ